MSNPPTPKRGRGRPRNPSLDALEKELAVSRRHASTLLRDMKAGASDKSEKAVSPLAQARLEKIQREIEFLEIRIRNASLEERALSRELLYTTEALELLTAALAPIADGLKTWPKALAPRLHSQPIRAIEDTLAEAVNRILENARRNVAAFKEKTSRDL